MHLIHITKFALLVLAGASWGSPWHQAVPVQNNNAPDIGLGMAASGSGHVPRSVAMPHRLSRASQSEQQRARRVIDDAMDEVSERNAARLANPARNRYRRHGNAQVPPSLFKITDDIADAAALVAEADVFLDEGMSSSTNGSSPNSNTTTWRRSALPLSLEGRAGSASTGFWMGQIKHQGSWPWGANPNNYTVCAKKIFVI